MMRVGMHSLSEASFLKVTFASPILTSSSSRFLLLFPCVLNFYLWKVFDHQPGGAFGVANHFLSQSGECHEADEGFLSWVGCGVEYLLNV